MSSLPKVQKLAVVIVMTFTLIFATVLAAAVPIRPADADSNITDFNGDGYEDLAIGVPDENVVAIADAGAVSVMYGSGSGLSATAKPDQIWTQNTANIEDSAEAGDRFGRALAAGDFNGDGYSDLAIGAPFENVGTVADAGSVNVIYGSSQGLRATAVAAGNGNLDQLFTQNSPSVDGDSEPGDQFGASLETGDFNNDGKDDLAIGVHGEDIGTIQDAGMINVLYGSASGLSATAIIDQTWHQDSPGIEDAAEASDIFGFSLAAGDFNKDGRDDLAVGVPYENSDNGGAFHIIYGSSQGLRANAVASGDGSVDIFIQNSNLPENMGFSLAAADFNGDAYADLAVGIPFSETVPGFGGLPVNSGAVTIYRGSATGMLPGAFFSQNTFDVEDEAEPNDSFGTSLVAGNFNGDAYADLAVGVLYEDLGTIVDAGAVNVIYGSSGGLSATTTPDQFWHQDSPGIMGRSEPSDDFGDSLAAGDFDNDGRDDLAIGVPGEGFDDLYDELIADVGAINVIYGSGGGLTPSDTQFFQQDIPQVEDKSESGDHFGLGMASS